MDILLIGFLVFIAYQIGVSVTAYRLRHIIFKAAREQGLKIDPELIESKHVIKCYIEKINDTLYLYDIEKNEFVCQGKTMDELADFSLKYKNIKSATVYYNNDNYAFENGKIVNK